MKLAHARLVGRVAWVTSTLLIATLPTCAPVEDPIERATVSTAPSRGAEARIKELRSRYGAALDSDGAFSHFAPDGSGLSAVFGERALLDVRLPRLGDGMVRLREPVSQMRVEFAPKAVQADTRDVEIFDNIALYRGGSGGDVIMRMIAGGMEDYVEVAQGDSLSYTLDVGAVEALRLTTDALEFLDEHGTPRIRVAGAYVLDSAGTRRKANLAIDDCNYDDSPSPNHGALAPLHSDHCTLTLRWDRVGLTYPVLVDPQWVGATYMTYPHTDHSMTVLPSGNVLIVSFNGLEVYDAVTNTFSPFDVAAWELGGLVVKRGTHTATSTSSGVVITGGRTVEMGDGIPLATTYIVTESAVDQSVSIEEAEALPFTRWEHVAVLRSDGLIALIGGRNDFGAIDLFDPASKKLVDPPFGTDIVRYHMTATPVPGGALIVGGRNPAPNCVAQDGVLFYDEAEAADPDLVLKVAPSLPITRGYHTATRLPDGSVLIAGGFGNWSITQGALDCVYNQAGGVSTLVYTLGLSPHLGTWSFGDNLLQGRSQHAAVVLADGSPLLIAGRAQAVHRNSTEVRVDDGMGGATWHPFPSIGFGLRDGEAVVLKNGNVLFAGGRQPGNGITQASYLLELDGQGDACQLSAECHTGSCVDGVCCDSPCAGACMGCSAAAKGTGVDGVCDFVVAGSPDPRNSCVDQGAPSCQTDGLCDGGGACTYYAAGTACTSSICIDETLTLGSCDGVGTCSLGNTDCAPYGCDGSGTVCATICTDDDDCATSAYCDAGLCLPRQANGEACIAANTCETGICTDGVCCNAPCEGQCEACDSPQSEGSCLPVSGDPHGTRPACDTGDAGDVCAARQCDGVVRDSCTGWSASDVTCAPGVCDDNVAVGVSLCDGLGSCGVPTTDACDPYLCSDGACTTECDSEADCGPNSLCGPDRKCAAGRRCEGNTALLPDGTVDEECGAFLCEAGRCLTSCVSSDDCSAPNVCDPDGVCGSPPPAPTGGCACTTTPQPSSAPAWLWTLLAAAVLRRRSARRQPLFPSH